MSEDVPQLKVSTGWIDILITGEPNVVPTFRGYAPVIPVQVKRTELNYILYISAKSIMESLEPLRKDNGGLFSNLEISVRKRGDDQMSPYEIRKIQ